MAVAYNVRRLTIEARVERGSDRTIDTYKAHRLGQEFVTKTHVAAPWAMVFHRTSLGLGLPSASRNPR